MTCHDSEYSKLPYPKTLQKKPSIQIGGFFLKIGAEMAKELVYLVASRLIFLACAMCLIFCVMGFALFALQIYTALKITVDLDVFRLAICIAMSICSFQLFIFLTNFNEKINSQMPAYLRM